VSADDPRARLSRRLNRPTQMIGLPCYPSGRLLSLAAQVACCWRHAGGEILRVAHDTPPTSVLRESGGLRRGDQLSQKRSAFPL
jgi:hypothetical protein